MQKRSAYILDNFVCVRNHRPPPFTSLNECDLHLCFHIQFYKKTKQLPVLVRCCEEIQPHQWKPPIEKEEHRLPFWLKVWPSFKICVRHKSLKAPIGVEFRKRFQNWNVVMLDIGADREKLFLELWVEAAFRQSLESESEFPFPLPSDVCYSRVFLSCRLVYSPFRKNCGTQPEALQREEV